MENGKIKAESKIVKLRVCVYFTVTTLVFLYKSLLIAIAIQECERTCQAEQYYGIGSRRVYTHAGFVLKETVQNM